MFRTKLKAYTLPEVIVVLVISAIVVGIGFSALRLVHHHISVYRTYEKTKLQILSTETKLNLLFHQSEQLRIDGQQLTFFTHQDTISLEIFDKHISIDADSIPLKVKSFTSFFKGEPAENGVLDALELSIEVDKNIVKPIFVYKRTDTKQKAWKWESR